MLNEQTLFEELFSLVLRMNHKSIREMTVWRGFGYFNLPFCHVGHPLCHFDHPLCHVDHPLCHFDRREKSLPKPMPHACWL